MEIPQEVLDIEIETLDDGLVTLQELIEETTDEDIELAKYVVSQMEDSLVIESFTAWTENKVLALYITPLGSHLEMYDRNPN